MSEQQATYPVIPLLRDGQGRPFFEYLLWKYYAEAFATLVERQRTYGPTNITQAGVAGVLEQARNKIERASAQLTGTVVNGKIVLDEMNGDASRSRCPRGTGFGRWFSTPIVRRGRGDWMWSGCGRTPNDGGALSGLSRPVGDAVRDGD